MTTATENPGPPDPREWLDREAAEIMKLHADEYHPGQPCPDTNLDRCAVQFPDQPDDECGCCNLNDYAEPDDDAETACENCGHSPEEHEDPIDDGWTP